MQQQVHSDHSRSEQEACVTVSESSFFELDKVRDEWHCETYGAHDECQGLNREPVDESEWNEFHVGDEDGCDAGDTDSHGEDLFAAEDVEQESKNETADNQTELAAGKH